MDKVELLPEFQKFLLAMKFLAILRQRGKFLMGFL